MSTTGVVLGLRLLLVGMGVGEVLYVDVVEAVEVLADSCVVVVVAPVDEVGGRD